MVGPEEISASHARSFERFESSRHLVAGHGISVRGDGAAARANLVAMHLWQGSRTNANSVDNFFIAGGVIQATLLRADGQWKISPISNNVIWRAFFCPRRGMPANRAKAREVPGCAPAGC
jgi:hypothetical protein